LIAKSAKTRFDILVTAVYWRVNEHVTAGLTRLSHANTTTPPLPPIPDGAAMPAKPRFDPLQEDEVVAFKKALASVTARPAAPVAGVQERSGRRNPLPETPQFRDTEIDESPSPLSGTQYGDLN